MSEVKRVDFFAYMDDEVAELDYTESEDGAWVPASDYDKLDKEYCMVLESVVLDAETIHRLGHELAELKAKMEGWQLVPVEPTAEMVAAAFVGKVEAQCVQHQERSRVAMAANYKAMLAAAPSKEGL